MGRKGKDDRIQNTLAQLARSIPFALLLGSVDKWDSPLWTEHWTKTVSCLLDVFLYEKRPDSEGCGGREVGGGGARVGVVRVIRAPVPDRKNVLHTIITLISFTVDNRVKTSVPPDPLDPYILRPHGYASGSVTHMYWSRCVSRLRILPFSDKTVEQT